MTKVLRVKGLDKVQRKFKRFPEDFEKGLRTATMDAVLHVQETLPKYPPKPATSTYRRTGTLGRTITSLVGRHPDALSRVKALGSAVVGLVGTKLKYARFVIDADQQAGHMRHWWTLQGSFEGARREIVKIYERMIRDIIKRRA